MTPCWRHVARRQAGRIAIAANSEVVSSGSCLQSSPLLIDAKSSGEYTRRSKTNFSCGALCGDPQKAFKRTIRAFASSTLPSPFPLSCTAFAVHFSGVFLERWLSCHRFDGSEPSTRSGVEYQTPHCGLGCFSAPFCVRPPRFRSPAMQIEENSRSESIAHTLGHKAWSFPTPAF